jgi:hypothetical protein
MTKALARCAHMAYARPVSPVKGLAVGTLIITTQGWLTLAASEPPPYPACSPIWYMQLCKAWEHSHGVGS